MAEERVTFPCGEISIEGALHLPSGGEPPYPGVVVCHPHPQYGGDMGNNVVMAMVRGLAEQGVAALRFNFRGVGLSQGHHDGRLGEQEDATAAFEYLRFRPEIDDGQLGMAGYSFGAGVALAVAPTLNAVRAAAVAAPPTPSINTPAILGWNKPKLFLAGDADTSVPIEQVHELMRRMAQPPKIEVLHGGDHFLWGHEEAITSHVGAFFGEVFASQARPAP